MILARAACTPAAMLTACTCTKHQSMTRHLPWAAARTYSCLPKDNSAGTL